jgi:glycosyltransferase involved in cell wall biosynthesis
MNADTNTKSDIAIAHWGEHVNGGGDRVAWEIARVFDDAPLFVGWRDESIEPNDVSPRQIINGRLKEWALGRGGILRMLAYMTGWQIAEPLRKYDVLITSGNEPLFYVPPTEQTWVAYIHHTNRRQSDQIGTVGDGTAVPIKLLYYYLIRVAFDHNTHKPDLFLANSEVIKRRMVRYWGIPEKKIDVVYPPVETGSYSSEDAVTEEYYLTLSRLDWHKSVDDIIRAFNEISATLVVAGDGPERDELEQVANENIEFKGYVDEDRKKKLLSGAKAFVFNGQDEDFGISPVEALAAGTPLLGVEEGMTQFQIIDGQTGYTFQRDVTGETIRAVVDRFERDGVKWDDTDIEAFADRFSVQKFHTRIEEAVQRALKNSNTTPDWYPEAGAASNSLSKQ